MARKNATPRVTPVPSVTHPGGFQPTAPADPMSPHTDDKNKRALIKQDPKVYVFDQNGALHCSESGHTPLKGKTAWCKDVEYAIRANLDANWCFDPGQLIVPMFPTFYQFAEVRVDDNVLAGSRQLYIPIRKGGNFTDGLDFVGFISPGEGRMILRGMLVEWMTNKQSLIVCESKLHGFKAEKIANSYADNPGWTAANSWACLTDGLCMPCMSSLNNDTGLDFL